MTRSTRLAALALLVTVAFAVFPAEASAALAGVEGGWGLGGNLLTAEMLGRN